MALVEDPNTGEWYDDGTGDMFGGAMFGGTTSPFLGGGPAMGSLPQFIGDYNRYGQMEPYEQADWNQQLTGLNNYLGRVFDPRLGLLNSVMTGAPTFDPMALMGGGLYGLDNRYLSGGGGAGGGGGGGGAQGLWTTPTLDAARNSTDPVIQGIAQSVDSGLDPFSITRSLADTTEGDQNALDTYRYAAEAMFEEKAGADRSMMQAGMQGPEMTPLAAQMARTGLPNPLEGYTAENVPIEAEAFAPVNTALTRAANLQRQSEDMEGAVFESPNQFLPREQWTPTPESERLVNEYRREQVEAGTRGPFEFIDPNRPWQPFGVEPEAEDRTYGGLRASFDPTPRAPQAGTPWGRPAGVNQVINRMRDRNVQIAASDTPYWTTDPATGNRQLTNQAGRNQRGLERRSQNATEFATRVDREIRELRAAEMQRRGESPIRNALQAQMDFIRSMGIGV